MKKTLLAGSICALALSGTAWAQDNAVQADDVIELETIVVTTPLRRDSSLERATSSVTVIGHEEIAKSSAVDLPSLLSTVPGINITTSGGMGAAASLSLRGASSSQTLVLIDGVNVRSATLGSTALYNMPLGSIERIEIAKGAHSAQYGADAIGGVVNIITQKGAAHCPDGKEICTTITTGILHPWGGHTSANIHGTAQDGTRFNIGGNVIGTQGYNFTTPGNPSYEPDKDGFLLGSLNASAEKDFDWGQAYATALYSRSRVKYDAAPSIWDPAPANEADTATLAAKIGARFDHAQDWQSQVEFSLGYDEQEDFRKGTPTRNRYETLRYGIFAATTKEFETGGIDHVFTVGGEAFRESIDSTEIYDVTARNRGAVFAQHSLELGALTVDGGIRYDDDQLFGDATTYNIGVSYEVLPGLTARASYGTGFRAPTFNDLYWPADPWTAGNPDLGPERSKGYEVGLAWRPTEATILDLAFYQSWVRDQINWQYNPVTDITQPVNINRVHVTGFEASLTHHFDAQWRGRAWLDIRDPRDQDGFYVMRQERLKIGAEVGYRPLEELELTLGVQHVGPRDDSDPATFDRIELPSYTLVDIGAVYSFDAYSHFKLSVSNLFDKDYSTAAGYRSPGRTIDVSLSKTF